MIPAGAVSRAELVREARKEGRLVWYVGPNPVTRLLVERFRRRFPFVRLETVPLDGPVIGERFLSEKARGDETVDVLSGGAGQSFPLFRAKHYLARLDGLPSWPGQPAEAKDAAGFWFSYMVMRTVLLYNRHMVADRDVPRTYRDFVHARWREQVVVVHPSSRGWGMAFFRFAAAHPKLGEPWVRRLAALRPLFLYQAGGVLTQTILEGGRPLGYGRDLEYVFAKRAGEAIGMREMPEGFLLQSMPAAVNAAAPHPAAARLFADWLMSEETRDFVGGLGFGYPLRSGFLKRALADGAWVAPAASPADVRAFVERMSRLAVRGGYVPSVPPSVRF
jgi:ABC-type Fe3+ transport system substrate-binding protein